MAHRRKRYYIYCQRQVLLEYREIKRRRHRLKIRGRRINYMELTCMKRFRPKALNYLDERWRCDSAYSSSIIIPQNLSFKENFDESADVVKNLLYILLHKRGDITIDFSNCKNLSFSAIFFMNLLLRKYLKSLYLLRNVFGRAKRREIKMKPPKNNDDLRVYKYLHAMGLYTYDGFKDSDGEFMRLGIEEGKYRGITDNRKGVVGKKIVTFINNAYEPLEKKLTLESQNLIESLTSEILNNAEDHSLQNNEWYVDGIALHETIEGQEVVELNLVIFNLGDSMYEAFEKTKEANKAVYDILESRYELHKGQFYERNQFEKESLFTLYMLNEGISRLKYEDPSRGNGTMQFLKAFADLGSKSVLRDNRKSSLNVISGHTVLTCDDEVIPFHDGTHLKISLNKEKDNKKLPESQYLKYYSRYIPGTFIDCKIYITDNLVENV